VVTSFDEPPFRQLLSFRSSPRRRGSKLSEPSRLRVAAGDPRPSLEERYGDHAGFVAKVRAAAADLQAKGFLLPDDAQRLVREAEQSAVLSAR
jgi:hypothetical protein